MPKTYSKPKPMSAEEQAWFESMIRLQTKSEPVQLEMKLDLGCTEFGNGFDDSEDELLMVAEVVHEPK